MKDRGHVHPKAPPPVPLYLDAGEPRERVAPNLCYEKAFLGQTATLRPRGASTAHTQAKKTPKTETKQNRKHKTYY